MAGVDGGEEGFVGIAGAGVGGALEDGVAFLAFGGVPVEGVFGGIVR